MNLCLEEVNGYQSGEKINYSHLARKYNLIDSENKKPQNGLVKIVKELLKENGINLTILSERKRRIREKMLLSEEKSGSKIRLEITFIRSYCCFICLSYIFEKFPLTFCY